MLLLRIVVLMMLWMPAAFGAWQYSSEVSLQKDQFERLLIKNGNSERLLEFRWTLYSEESLIVHRAFDGRIAQHVLKRNHTNQSFRVELLPRSAYKIRVPYVMVRFIDFDHSTDEALMGIYLSDPNEEIMWESLKSE